MKMRRILASFVAVWLVLLQMVPVFAESEMEKQQKASAEEKARVAKGASFIQSLLTFTF